MEEQWMPVKGYEGLFEVSNHARIRSLKNTRHNDRKEPKIKNQFIGSWGYYVVTLCKDGKSTPCLVHRLIAEAFIPNPDNLQFINHKDEDKTNNNIDNLEWCSQEYNNKYGTARERGVQTKRNNHTDGSKMLYQCDRLGNLIKAYDSIKSASIATGIHVSTLSNCANGKPHYKTAHGYIWRFA